MSGMLVISPRDDIMARYGRQLRKLGDQGQTHRIMARAMNYEGKRGFVIVKRVLRKQTSIPRQVVERSMQFINASTKGGALETKIVGKGRALSLKFFGPKQFAKGTKATVWGRRQMYPGLFMGPKPGVLAPALHGHVFHRVGKARLPVKKAFGPSIPKEMVKDETAKAFYASAFKIVDRVGKEIEAVMRGH
jgi:hypothetical protein